MRNISSLKRDTLDGKITYVKEALVIRGALTALRYFDLSPRINHTRLHSGLPIRHDRVYFAIDMDREQKDFLGNT